MATEWMPRRPGDDWEEINGVVVPPIPLGTLVSWESPELDATLLATVDKITSSDIHRLHYEIRATGALGHDDTSFDVAGKIFKALRSQLTVIERTPEGIERFLEAGS